MDDSSTSPQAMRRIIINAGMLCDVAGNGKEVGIDAYCSPRHRMPFKLGNEG